MYAESNSGQLKDSRVSGIELEERGGKMIEEALYSVILKILKLSALIQRIKWYVWVVRQVLAVLNLKQWFLKWN